MTVKEFLATYNYSPWDISELACFIESNIDDDDKLVKAAAEFLQAELALGTQLTKIDFTFG